MKERKKERKKDWSAGRREGGVEREREGVRER